MTLAGGTRRRGDGQPAQSSRLRNDRMMGCTMVVRSCARRRAPFVLHLEKVGLRRRLPQDRLGRGRRRRNHFEVAHGGRVRGAVRGRRCTRRGRFFSPFLKYEFGQMALDLRTGNRALVMAAFLLEHLEAEPFLPVVLRSSWGGINDCVDGVGSFLVFLYFSNLSLQETRRRHKHHQPQSTHQVFILGPYAKHTRLTDYALIALLISQTLSNRQTSPTRY